MNGENMRYLIYGAGTIGITYAWLLSKRNDVTVLVKPERYETLSKGISLSVKNLKQDPATHEKIVFYPKCVTELTEQYDGILVAVNRCQLQSILPILSEQQHLTKYFALMQNNWNLEAELSPYLPADKYIVAFPSTIGGGRENNCVEVILFEEATRLGGQCQFGIANLTEELNQAGIETYYDEHIFDWLKVHYLQQSITAGAVLECGDFLHFANDYKAVKKMVKAFREGIKVCHLQGVCVNKTFPANLFKLPVFLVAHIMQKMFLDPNTVEMVNNHMKEGLPEWIAGYKEVLQDGVEAGLPMTVWKSYYDAIK